MKHNITNSNLSAIFFDIEKELEKNSETIKQLLKIDQKYCNIQINLEKLKNVIKYLKNEKLDIKKEQKVIIKYNGNPCITLNLCILAIITKNIIIFDYENNMVGINFLIIQIVNNILKKYKTDRLIYLINENKDADKIICIDDINQYNRYLQEKNIKIQFYSYDYIDFYSDSDEFEEIEELIYQYAENNLIPIEKYSELDIDEASQMMQKGIGNNVVVLTNNEKTKEIFNRKIKHKKLYINKNPFEKNIRIIDKEILYI